MARARAEEAGKAGRVRRARRTRWAQSAARVTGAAPVKKLAAVLLGAVWVLAPGRMVASGSSSRPAPAEQVESLIRQLDSDSFARREAATKALMELGAPGVPALRAALDGGKLPLEVSRRVELILVRIDVPAGGVVWRARAGFLTPSGLKDGDVILRVGDVQVHHPADVLRQADVSEGLQFDATIWRKGEGTLKTAVVMDPRSARRFTSWPDGKEIYARHGQKGSWDSDVAKGLDLKIHGDPNCLGSFRAAWEGGCRDLTVLKEWVEALYHAGQLDEARRVAAEESPKAQDTYPPGRVPHGEFAVSLSRMHLLAGRAEDAARVLEEALPKLLKAAGADGVAVIRRQQLILKLNESAEAGLAFAQAQRDQLRLAEGSSTMLLGFTEALACQGDPGKALALLDGLGDSPGAKELRGTYEAQRELARRTADRKGPHPVLIWQEETPSTLKGGPRHPEIARSRRLRPPCRFECQVRMVDPLPASSGVPTFARIGLVFSGYQSALEVVVDRCGLAHPRAACCPDLGLLAPEGIPMAKPGEWHQVSLDFWADAVRVTLDGRTVRTWHHDRKPEDITPLLMAGGCTAEFRNLRAYAVSDSPADNARIEQALSRRQQAMLAGDLDAVRREHRVLQEAWAKVPAAGAVAQEAASVLAWYEALFSKEGLRLCTKEMMDSQAAHKEGAWRLHAEWLVATADGSRTFGLFQLPLLTPDIEITGVIDVQDPGQQTEWQLLWNEGEIYWSSSGRAGNTYVKYWPNGPRIWLGPLEDRLRPAKLPPVEGPMPFCVRARGDQAVLFLKDGAKPLLRYAGTKRTVSSFNLRAILMDEDTKVRFGRIAVRHLPADRKLDDPADLPAVPG